MVRDGVTAISGALIFQNTGWCSRESVTKIVCISIKISTACVYGGLTDEAVFI